MYKTFQFVLFAVLATFAFQNVQADLITEWTVEDPTTPADLPNSAAGPSVPASTGTGTLLGVHAGAETDWTTPAGNGSANSYSVNTWAVGDYFEFSTSTSGYQAIEVCFDQTSSNTGPRDFVLSYSSTGTSGPYTDYPTGYTVLANAAPNTPWSAAGPQLPEFRSCFDLSGVAALDDNSSVAFRLTQTSTVSANGGTVAAGGTSRVDNIAVNGTFIPEPASFVLALFGMAILTLARR